jgi:phosphopantothenate---cysteine ligase (ATP)
LETDAALLPGKATRALAAYAHDLVVGNLLRERKHHVTLFFPDGRAVAHRLTADEVAAGAELEPVLVAELARLHHAHRHAPA